VAQPGFFGGRPNGHASSASRKNGQNGRVKLPVREKGFFSKWEFVLWAFYSDWIREPDGKWAAQREAWYSRHEKKCFVCTGPNRIRLHHTTYERADAPLDEDLVSLCEECHQRVHEYVEQHLDKDDSLLIAHRVLRQEFDQEVALRKAESDRQAAKAHESYLRKINREDERRHIARRDLAALNRLEATTGLTPAQKMDKVNLEELLQPGLR